MAHLFLQKREGERKERCVKSCMALLNEKVGFRLVTQIIRTPSKA